MWVFGGLAALPATEPHPNPGFQAAAWHACSIERCLCVSVCARARACVFSGLDPAADIKSCAGLGLYSQ